MLNILGRNVRLCDQVPRRGFLSVGSLVLGGLTLPKLIQAEESAGIRNSHKSVIMVYLTGGPPHQDMFDLKPDAPSDIRGEFKPIETNVPGIRIGEHFGRISNQMDKWALIRSLVGSEGRHSSFQCATGRRFSNQPGGGWPELGSVLSRLEGPVSPSVPPAVDLSMKMAHQPYNLPGPGFLGAANSPFKPSSDALKDMVLNGVNSTRMKDRTTLLSSLSQNGDQPSDHGAYTRKALDVLTSSKLVDALDLSKESPRIRERYGKDDEKVLSYSHLGYQAHMSKFLIARRLVEAGARVVTVAFADFDWHGGNFSNGRKVHPLLDQGLSALIDDLYERGLEQDVSVVVWGEFGRTPKVNPSGGRDHWPQVTFAMLAGGGMRTGQVIGATDKHAATAIDRPVHYQEVIATLYHRLGIDLDTTIPDLRGRPHYLVDEHLPIHELI